MSPPGGVAGADEQRTVGGDLGPAPRVPTGRDRQAGQQVAHPLGRRPVRREPPGHEPDVVGVAALLVRLAGREQPRGREVGVHDHPHEPALALHEDVVEVGADLGALGPLAQPRHDGDPPRPLGHERPPVGEEPDVPPVLEPLGDDLDRQVGHGGVARSRARGRFGASDAVLVAVDGTSPTESSPEQAARVAVASSATQASGRRTGSSCPQSHPARSAVARS